MRLIVAEGSRDNESVAAIGTTADLAMVQVARGRGDHVALKRETIEPQAKRGASIRVSTVANDQGE